MKFNQTSYDLSNDIAISKTTAFLEKHGYTVIPKKEEDYGLDIKAITPMGETEYWECETKGYNFTSEKDFPFPTVSFLGRKEKWKNIGFWYIIINKRTLAYVKCHSSVIFQDRFKQRIKIHTNYRKGLDTFYRVPKDLCQWGIIE